MRTCQQSTRQPVTVAQRGLQESRAGSALSLCSVTDVAEGLGKIQTWWICLTRSGMQTVCQPPNMYCGHPAQVLKLSTSPIKIPRRLRNRLAVHFSHNRFVFQTVVHIARL